MRHVEKALLRFKEVRPLDETPCKFISIDNMEDTPGVAPVVKFTIQSDPVSLVGVNGCQAQDILEYTKYLFESLNAAFPCVENKLTIDAITLGLKYQDERTRNRIKRGVEGENKK